MSGDVQPRKRKDKRRKRDSLDRRSDGDLVFSRKQSLQDDEPREHHQGVHGSKMGSDDVHLHVQDEHETGGHWCAKLFFFALLAILFGLVGLIILENRGLSDLDTPLSESRFSNYFDGWVDEHRESHDEHDVVSASIEEHEHGDEPFEEEEDHSEADEADDEGDDKDHETEEEDEEDTKDTEEEEDDEDATEEVRSETVEEEDETQEDDNQTEEDEEEEEDDADDKTVETVEEPTAETREDDDDDDDDDATNNDDKDDNDNTQETNENDDDDEDEDDTAEVVEPVSTRAQRSAQQATSTQSSTKEDGDDDDDDDEPFDEEEDDGTFESLESVVVDNDAEELLLLQEKARKQQEASKKDEPQQEKETSSYTSSQIKSRGGGPQSMDDDAFDEELRKANEEMLRESYNSALTRFESLSKHFPDKPGAFLGKARALDMLSEIHRSNSELGEALKAYKRYLAFGEDILNDVEFTEVAQRCVDRMRFMGVNLQAIPIHEMLIERFPDEVTHRNQLAVTHLMANRLSDAKRVLEEILSRWPTNGFALVHYGFVLKNLDKNLVLAVQYLRSGIDTQAEGTQDGRFYFNLGDSLQRLGRVDEAREIYRRAADLKLFLSEYQRSLYNVDTLRAQAFWTKKETGYQEFLDKIEDNWQTIREEGLSTLNAKGFFQDETENLRDSGDWKQFELFARGQRMRENCLKAPITCGIIEMFPSSRFCKRGQVKFSVMHPGTHVWPHCGPTNCRLRAHLGLIVPPGTLLRVANEKRTWQEGKFLIFDDSFEHEVWHNGTSLRLVLIVDFWHPDLTEKQRQSLSPI